MNDAFSKELSADAESLKNLPKADISALDKSDTLIVVVDLVKGFTAFGALSSERGNKLVPRAAEFLKRFEKARIAFLRDRHEKDSREFSAFPEHCVGEESELDERLSGIKGLDVPKNSTDGLTALLGAIDPTDYKSFVLIGLCTDICVLQLALSLNALLNELNLKGSVTVVTDLTDTFDAEGHNAELNNLIAYKLMAGAGVKLVKSE